MDLKANVFSEFMYEQGIESVRLADLYRVAKKYIEPSNLAVLIAGNES